MTDNYGGVLEFEESRTELECGEWVRHIGEKELLRPTKEEAEAERHREKR